MFYGKLRSFFKLVVDVASMSEDEFWDFLTSKGIGEIDLEILKGIISTFGMH